MEQTNKKTIIELESDYHFKPTNIPFSRLTSEEKLLSPKLVAGLQSGWYGLVLRRNLTPNRWFVTKAIHLTPSDIWPLAETESVLDYFSERSLMMEESWSGSRVEYGPEIMAYARTSGSTTFNDQGLPLWSLFVADVSLVQKQILRCNKAAQSVAWFERQFNTSPVEISQLPDAALLLLARIELTTWMYRSVAQPILDLVRAGFGRVTLEGKFVCPDEQVSAEASQVAHARGLELQWTNPSYIETRITQYYNNPRNRYTTFKGKLPQLMYGN